MRIVANIVIFAIEVAAIIAVAWLARAEPLLFAAATALLALGLGTLLELHRLRNELPFYFERPLAAASLATWVVAVLEATVKAILAGLVALLTFSGTDEARLAWVAAIFAATVFAGTSLLRRLVMSLDARPARWGWFRLAAPLGLIFSLALTILLPPVSLVDLGTYATFRLPERPGIGEAAELLFLLKSAFDQLIVTLLSQAIDPDLARVAGAVISTNVLAGFVAALYAVMIADGVRRLEARAERTFG
jgi:hypothetical protein